jgi:hypothetical protein
VRAYTELLESLLVMEYNKTPERARELIHKNQDIVSHGIPFGNMSLRGVAMQLDHIDGIQALNDT